MLKLDMETPTETEKLVILDFGSQYTQLIARVARQLGIFSIILPFSTTLSEIKKLSPKGIIFSGGPDSVYLSNAPKIDKKIIAQDIPILGICYGLQLITTLFGGKVESSKKREYGSADITVKGKSSLLGLGNSKVWMSHGDHVTKPPEGFKITSTSNGIICSIENNQTKIFGLQFHPEVTHTYKGENILKKFLIDICGFSGDWSPSSFIPDKVGSIKKLVGDSKVICALSGGVDSSVAATLVNKAIGSQQICIFIDTGLLRKNEYEEVLEIYKRVGLKIKAIKARKQFLAQLKGVESPEKKRKIIGSEFIKIFEKEAKQIKDAKFLVQGTLYPDVIESVSVNGPSVTIKSHHNVGGLPKKMKLELLEPLRELFKDEVRVIGKDLGLPEDIVQRQPFPGPGLAVRIIGKVTKKSLLLLKEADKILTDELEASNERKSLWQFFAVLLPIKSVGVMGDGRTYEKVIVLRAVQSTDVMTADYAKLPHDLLGKISSRITNEVKGINRVVYDITSKPPGTVEWE
jgi:GMP synthase (glutamine-hydrolysing)